MKDAAYGHKRSLPRNLPPVPGKKTAAARCGGLSFEAPPPAGEGSFESLLRDFHGYALSGRGGCGGVHLALGPLATVFEAPYSAWPWGISRRLAGRPAIMPSWRGMATSTL